jgi:alpha-galactosidase
MLDTVAQLRAAKASGSLPLDLVQLDDGWQSCWGDWDLPHSKRFPNGLTPIAAAIKAAGMSPGLWMAPAALTADSRLFAEHPEWVLMDSNAKPLRCGYTAPGIWLHALDVSHPGALAHVRRVVGIATREWGFEYLKLDFLHAAAMPGGVRHDPSTSRAELLGRLMAAIRAEVGEHVFILGCGAPLGPCIGHVDAMRVSADAAPHWYPRVSDLPLVRSLFTSDRTNMPAARNMVRNVAVRMQLGGRLWRNDPDCLILRDAGADFTTGQAQALSTMAVLSAGALIFSDRPEDLTGARLAILQALLPPLPRAAVAADLLLHEVPTQLVLPLTQADLPLPGCTTLGEWWLVAFFNWSNQQAVPGSGGAALGFLLEAAESTDAPLPVSVRKPAIPAAAAATWHVFNFWEGSYSRLSDNDATAMLQPPPVPPRCCSLLAIRRVMPDGADAQYIGSNVHCSCGLEVRLWHQTSSTAASSSSVLEFALGTGRAVTAPLVWLYLPGTISDGQRRPTVSAMDALSNEGATPSIEWAADQVWVVRLASIGVSGDSGVHHIVY